MAVLARQVIYLEIAKIERDAELQARVGLNEEVVKDYAEQMAAGATFPPVLVFERPGAWALVDGFHRIAARESLGLDTVLAETRAGTRDEAIWYGLAANQKHGLRRSNEDKHRCVVKALTHPQAQLLSDRQLASHCGVHHYTVSRIRRQLETSQVIEVKDTRVVTRGGVSYIQRLQKRRSAPLPASTQHAVGSPVAVPEAPALGAVPSEPEIERSGVFPPATLVAAAENTADTPVTGSYPRLSRRLECVSHAPDQPNLQERLRQLIRSAHGNVDEALEELTRAQCESDRYLKRLLLHLTHLRRELSSAEGRLAEPAEARLHGVQGS